MRGFLTALRFLTIIPAGADQADGKDLPSAIIYFPAVGLFIGLILIPVIWMAKVSGLNEMVLGSIIVVILIAVTGGLHLDGLADTFDAISSGKPKDEMLKIMRDPHIGTMGVLALVSIILLKLSFLSCLPPRGKAISVILMCVMSRWSLVMVMAAFPYARNEGKAKTFMEGIDPRMAGLATLITFVIAAVIARLQGVIILMVVGLAAYLTARLIARKLGGITGDTLGAVSELMEVVTLFSVCMLGWGAR